MVFNMGMGGFRQFRKTIEAIKSGRWREAAAQMLDCRWAAQVGSRARELASMMETVKVDGRV